MHAADNDIRSERDVRSRPSPTTLPQAVARRILHQVVNDARKYFTQAEWRESKQSCSLTVGKVFRVAGPAGLQLYVARRYFAFNPVDYFVMYDPRTGAATAAPPLVSTRWSSVFAKHDWLFKAPIVRIEAARGDRPPLVVVEEQLHGGTVYNAVIYHYFEVGRDMALTQVLAVEARAMLESSVPRSLVQDYIVRKATFLTANRVRLDVSSRSSRTPAFQGSVLLERDHPGQPFHVGRRMPAQPGDAEGLVTYCESPKSDDDFLRLGCDS